jgi:hypothetical protein
VLQTLTPSLVIFGSSDLRISRRSRPPSARAAWQ